MSGTNFVVIYADDLGYGDLGCYGSGAMRTPHLDALAARGVRFTNWYANSPVCSPSRAALLTGRYPQRTSVSTILGGKRGTRGLPADERTLATRLKERGYATGLSGKWHLGTAPMHAPNAHGFDEAFGFLAGCVDYYSHIFYWGQARGVNPVHDLWQDGREVWENGRYLTELITERAVDFIARHAREPFFLYVPYNAPHYPMHAPREYLDRFPDLPPDRRVMAAMIAAMDDGVGAIVDALRRVGTLDETVIFFSSDNGPSTESRNWLDGREDPYYGGSAGHFRGHKASLFEGGIREPALLSYPALLPGGQIRAEVGAMVDIAPTFLALAGVPAPEGLDGRDVLPMLVGEPDPTSERPARRLFWEYAGQLAVRDGDWKLVLEGQLDFDRPAADRVHLADLATDPGERTNLRDRHPDIVTALTAAARAWQAEVSGARGVSTGRDGLPT